MEWVFGIVVVLLAIDRLYLGGKVKELRDIVSQHEKTLSQSDISLSEKIRKSVDYWMMNVISSENTSWTFLENKILRDVNSTNNKLLNNELNGIKQGLIKTGKCFDMLMNHLGLEVQPEHTEPERIVKKPENTNTTTGTK